MQPGQFAPKGEDWLVRKVQELERSLTELRAANVFGLTGIRPKDGGTDLDGFVNINGPLEVNGQQTVNGDSEFTGDMKVSGTLDLPAGIIGNAALAAPLESHTTYADADGFTLTPAEQDFCNTSFTVPEGYTTAVVVATGTVNTYNSNAAPDYLWARAYINAGFGRRMFALMDANSGPASLTVNKQVQLTGLSGGQLITCKLRLASQTANVTSGSNGASMNAFALFTR
jgi:hypothetical protein